MYLPVPIVLEEKTKPNDIAVNKTNHKRRYILKILITIDYDNNNNNEWYCCWCCCYETNIGNVAWPTLHHGHVYALYTTQFYVQFLIGVADVIGKFLETLRDWRWDEVNHWNSYDPHFLKFQWYIIWILYDL